MPLKEIQGRPIASQRLECHELLAGALNFRDVMLAYGKLSRNQMAHDSGGDNIGFEFSGTVASFPQVPCLPGALQPLRSLLARLSIVAVNKACRLPLRDAFLTSGSSPSTSGCRGWPLNLVPSCRRAVASG